MKNWYKCNQPSTLIWNRKSKPRISPRDSTVSALTIYFKDKFPVNWSWDWCLAPLTWGPTFDITTVVLWASTAMDSPIHLSLYNPVTRPISRRGTTPCSRTWSYLPVGLVRSVTFSEVKPSNASPDPQRSCPYLTRKSMTSLGLK